MGKSAKKVKSDRINALRKQYDAFLEEDKKRKERNEYILGRLDKMRYSTAVVPVRQALNPSITRPSPVYHLGYQQRVPATRDILIQDSVITKNKIIPDIPLQNVDNYLIQEISKNYILIPKLRSPFLNNSIQQEKHFPNADNQQKLHVTEESNNIRTSDTNRSTDDSNDWKSKYEILNILKQEEKEKQITQFDDGRTPEMPIKKEGGDSGRQGVHFANNSQSGTPLKKDYVLNDMYGSGGDNHTMPDKYLDAGNKYLEELPEKDTPSNTVNNTIIIDENMENTFIQADPVQHLMHDNEIKASNIDEIQDIENKLQNATLEYNSTDLNDGKQSDDIINNVEQENHNSEVGQTYYPETNNPEMSGDQLNYTEYYEPAYNVSGTPDDNTAHQNIESNENGFVDNQGHLDPQQQILAEQYTQQQYTQGDSDNVVYVDEQDTNSVQVISSNELVEEIQNDSILPDPKSDDYVEYTNENVNVQETSPNIDLHMKSSGSIEMPSENRDAEEPHTGVDIVSNPETQMEPDTEIKEDPVGQEEPVDAVGIETFNAEQRDLFYAEQPTENYGYQQDEMNAYDQTYAQNEPYPENQNYAYYEGTEQEAYPIEQGENDDQTLRYDPTYQQQYVESYETKYEQQEPQQYEEPQTYDQVQPEIEQLNYDNGQEIQEQLNYEGTQQIEAQLNAEDGYTEQQPQELLKPENSDNSDEANKPTQ